MSTPPKAISRSSSPLPSDGGPIICPGHSRPVPNISFGKVTPDGIFLISSCLDGKAMLREGDSGDWIGSFVGHKGAVWCAKLNSGSTQAVTGSADYTVRLWDAVTGACIHTFTHNHMVKACNFTKDDQKVFTSGNEKVVRVFDISKPAEAVAELKGHSGAVTLLNVCPDPNLILSAGADDKEVKIWDLRNNECVRLLPHNSGVSDMTLSSDDSVISTAAGNVVSFWDSTTFEKLKSVEMSRAIDCVSLHTKGNTFITGSSSELWLRVYNYETEEEIACNKGHHGPVRSVDFNPTGLHFASGSEDGTIRIWDLNVGESA